MNRYLSTNNNPSNSPSNQEFLNDYIEWVLTKKIWKEMINANHPHESDYATLVKPKDLGTTGLSQEDKETIKYMGGIQLYKFSSDAMCIDTTVCNNSISLALDFYLSHYTPLSFVQDEPVKIWKGVNVLPSGINAPFTKKLVYSFNMPLGTIWYGSTEETLPFMQSKTTSPYFIQTNPHHPNPHVFASAEWEVVSDASASPYLPDVTGLIPGLLESQIFFTNIPGKFLCYGLAGPTHITTEKEAKGDLTQRAWRLFSLKIPSPAQISKLPIMTYRSCIKELAQYSGPTKQGTGFKEFILDNVKWLNRCCRLREYFEDPNTAPLLCKIDDGLLEPGVNGLPNQLCDEKVTGCKNGISNPCQPTNSTVAICDSYSTDPGCACFSKNAASIGTGYDVVTQKYMDRNSPIIISPKCILNACKSIDAYKTAAMLKTDCPNLCTSVLNLQSVDKSNIGQNNIDVSVKCGSGGQKFKLGTNTSGGKGGSGGSTSSSKWWIFLIIAAVLLLLVVGGVVIYVVKKRKKY